jgi:hypothetical protein
MTIYLKSTLNINHLSRITRCVTDLAKSGEFSKLYNYSIPYGLRNSIFKTLSIPTFAYEIEESKLYPFTKFISKNTKVFLSKKNFHIKINHSELHNLNTIIHFLNQHSSDYVIYVDCEFTNADIPFIESILSKFPKKKLYFKLSDIEFSYVKVKGVNGGIIYTETDCLLERLEIGLPNYYEKDTFFRIYKNDKLTSDISIKRYYRIEDEKIGFVTENAMLPSGLEENSIILLQ